MEGTAGTSHETKFTTVIIYSPIYHKITRRVQLIQIERYTFKNIYNITALITRTAPEEDICGCGSNGVCNSATGHCDCKKGYYAVYAGEGEKCFGKCTQLMNLTKFIIGFMFLQTSS